MKPSIDCYMDYDVLSLIFGWWIGGEMQDLWAVGNLLLSYYWLDWVQVFGEGYKRGTQQKGRAFKRRLTHSPRCGSTPCSPQYLEVDTARFRPRRKLCPRSQGFFTTWCRFGLLIGHHQDLARNRIMGGQL